MADTAAVVPPSTVIAGLIPAKRAWEGFTPFLAFAPEIRKVIYTTNVLDSINFQLRKVTKARSACRGPVQVDIAPPQRQGFALTQPDGQCHAPPGGVAMRLGGGHHLPGLVRAHSAAVQSPARRAAQRRLVVVAPTTPGPSPRRHYRSRGQAPP